MGTCQKCATDPVNRWSYAVLSLTGGQGVVGSNPVTPTKCKPLKPLKFQWFWGFSTFYSYYHFWSMSAVFARFGTVEVCQKCATIFVNY